MRITLFGGSFNPVHIGHIGLARELLRQRLADEVWLVVSPQNPLKAAAGLLPDAQRLALARKGTGGIDGLRVSDIEMGMPRPSYTWHTLQKLAMLYPADEFSLLIGADNWALFPKWYRAEDIATHYSITVYPRSGYPIDPSALPPTVRLLDVPLLDISSTAIRRRVAAGQSIGGLVPREIEQQVNELYATTDR